MNLKYEGIIDIFTKLGKEKFQIWFSGIKGTGEFKEWYDNGQLSKHEFWKGGGFERSNIESFI